LSFEKRKESLEDIFVFSSHTTQTRRNVKREVEVTRVLLALATQGLLSETVGALGSPFHILGFPDLCLGGPRGFQGPSTATLCRPLLGSWEKRNPVECCCVCSGSGRVSRVSASVHVACLLMGVQWSPGPYICNSLMVELNVQLRGCAAGVEA